MQRSVTRRAPGISPSFIPSHRVAIDLRSGIGSSETGLSLSPRLLLMTIVTLVHGPRWGWRWVSVCYWTGGHLDGRAVQFAKSERNS
jgi:hypothetical protein